MKEDSAKGKESTVEEQISAMDRPQLIQAVAEEYGYIFALLNQLKTHNWRPANMLIGGIINGMSSVPELKAMGEELRKTQYSRGYRTALASANIPTPGTTVDRTKAPKYPAEVTAFLPDTIGEEPSKDVSARTTAPHYEAESGEGLGKTVPLAAPTVSDQEGGESNVAKDSMLGYSIEELSNMDPVTLSESHELDELKGLLIAVGGDPGKSRTNSGVAQKIVSQIKVK